MEELNPEHVVYHTDGEGLVAEQMGLGVRDIQILAPPLCNSVALGLDLIFLGLCSLKCEILSSSQGWDGMILTQIDLEQHKYSIQEGCYLMIYNNVKAFYIFK